MPVLQTTGSRTDSEHQAHRFFVQESYFVNATSTNSAATANGGSGIITTESLSTAAAGGAIYTMALTNSLIAVGDIVDAIVQNGTNTSGVPQVCSVTPSTGSCSIVITNSHTTAALSGTLKIAYTVIKAATQTTPNSI